MIKPIVIHLHGFVSSPNSRKAQYFKEQFAALGIESRIPDLNVPDFEHLTLTAMIERAAQEITTCPDAPIYLIGSSMGGAVALHLLNRKDEAARRVQKAVLLAPALDIIENRRRQLGEEGLARWHESGWLTVDHSGYGEKRQLHYGLFEDLLRYDSFAAQVETPLMIIHGRQDESVDYRQSVRFAEGRANVHLNLIDADHALLGVLPQLWAWTAEFLELETL